MVIVEARRSAEWLFGRWAYLAVVKATWEYENGEKAANKIHLGLGL